MDKEFIQKQKEKIASKIEVLERDLNKKSSYNDIGSASEDEATEFEEFEGNAALSKDFNKEIVELKSALKRIDDGTYGICKRCGGSIEEARLKAFPQSIYCASDK